MRVTLAAIALTICTAAAAPSRAAPLELVSLTETAEVLHIAWWWDTSVSLDDDVSALSHWNINLALFSGNGSSGPVINVYGRHESNFHSNDELPAMAYSAVLAPGLPTFVNPVPHPTTNPRSHHLDVFTFTASSIFEDGRSFLLMTAVHSVPEPQTYALMLAGLGLMGAATRRLRRGRP